MFIFYSRLLFALLVVTCISWNMKGSLRLDYGYRLYFLFLNRSVV